MNRLQVPESWKLYLNFPYISSQAGLQLPTPSLWQASVSNARQYLLASSRRYQRAATEHLSRLASSADRLILLVGSCGLEIFNQALQPQVAHKVAHIFVFGPVARRLPDVPHTLIQGSRDYLSQCFFRKVEVRIPQQGHMDYLRHEQVFQTINEALCYSISNC
jgi:hypothetical protein